MKLDVLRPRYCCLVFVVLPDAGVGVGDAAGAGVGAGVLLILDCQVRSFARSLGACTCCARFYVQ